MEKQLSRYMVKGPFVIETSATVKDARQIMRELEIRHLPVLEDGELVGLVSERDLAGDGPGDKKISEVMRTDLYVVPPSAALSEVVGTMLDRKLGSALVVDGDGDISGIFTTIDALRLLSEFLESDGEELSIDDYIEDWTELAI